MNSFHHSNYNPNFHNEQNAAGKENKPAGTFRSLDQVTCFKCGEKGHYANKCPKGHLAFLSPALQAKRNDSNQESM